MFSVIGWPGAAVGPVCVWLYSARRLTITRGHLVLRDTPGERQLRWDDIRHLTLRMTGNGGFGRVHVSVGTRTGTTEELHMRYVETELFRSLADDLFTPLHARGIPFIVESPDNIGAEIRARSGRPRLAPPPGPIPRMPDD